MLCRGQSSPGWVDHWAETCTIYTVIEGAQGLHCRESEGWREVCRGKKTGGRGGGRELGRG